MRITLLVCAFLLAVTCIFAQEDYSPKSYQLDFENKALVNSLKIVKKETQYDSTFRLYQIFTNLLAQFPELEGYTYVKGPLLNETLPSFLLTNGVDTLGRVFEVGWNKSVNYELDLPEGIEYLEIADYDLSQYTDIAGNKEDGTPVFRVFLHQHMKLSDFYGMVPVFMRAIPQK